MTLTSCQESGNQRTTFWPSNYLLSVRLNVKTRSAPCLTSGRVSIVVISISITQISDNLNRSKQSDINNARKLCLFSLSFCLFNASGIQRPSVQHKVEVVKKKERNAVIHNPYPVSGRCVTLCFFKCFSPPTSRSETKREKDVKQKLAR